MSRCVIYLRVSSITQSLGDGLSRQFDSCHARASRDGAWVHGVYCDVASGSGPLPQRAAAIAKAQELSRRVPCEIYVESIDRFTRRAGDFGGFDPLRIVQCEPLCGESESALFRLVSEAAR